MKKVLLSFLFTLFITCVVKADEVVVVFAGYDYQGDVTNKVEFPDGSTTTSINDKDFVVPNVCTFAFYKTNAATGDSYINPGGQIPHLQWAKQTMLNISPVKGITITKVTFTCTTSAYTQELAVDYPDNFGECVTDTQNKVTYWTGSATSDFGLVFTPLTKSNPIRFSYMTIEYSSQSSAIDSIAADENAPVKYFNINGVEIPEPVNAGVYIRQQGASTTKIMK